MMDAVKNTGAPRRYDASGPARPCPAGRREIAATLFVQHGYGRTTIADIAAAAGVSAETIYAAFKNKATLLHRVWDITIGGDDQDVVFHERPEVMAFRAEPDLRRRLVARMRFSTATAHRITPFLFALQGAAASEPAAAAHAGRDRPAASRRAWRHGREAAATGQLAATSRSAAT